MTRTGNITEMENRLNRAIEATEELRSALDKFKSVQADIAALNDYYGSPQWFRDRDDDSAGKLPANLHRGVLTEDSIYNMLTDVNELMKDMDSIKERSSLSFEVSCGAVVYTRQRSDIKYVIVKSNEGNYGFPKGHVEKDESETETALREIYEETGLSVFLHPNFRAIDEYPLPEKPGEIKRVVYFVGEYSGQTIRHQAEELSEARLMDYDEAMELLSFDSSRRILQEADDFLRGEYIPTVF